MKSPIASHPKSLDPSLDFCCQGPALTGIMKVDKMSVCISLTLEASEIYLSLHMIFSLERAAVVWAILERISGFDPSLEMTSPRYLTFSTSSSLWPFILISLWKPFGLFVITFVLSRPISILYLVVVLSRRQPLLPLLPLRHEYDAAFLMVPFTFCICILSDFFHIVDQWQTRDVFNQSNKVYPTCMVFTSINGNEDGKSGWCEFCHFSQ